MCVSHSCIICMLHIFSETNKLLREKFSVPQNHCFSAVSRGAMSVMNSYIINPDSFASIIGKKFTACFANINVITVAPPNYKSCEPVCRHNWRALSIPSVRYYQVRGTLALRETEIRFAIL